MMWRVARKEEGGVGDSRRDGWTGRARFLSKPLRSWEECQLKRATRKTDKTESRRKRGEAIRDMNYLVINIGK